MGRRENPLDPDAGPVQRFAYDLRELRRTAGGPTYRAMARDCPYSAPTLSAAAAGERLPSLAVTLAYVAACVGDASAAADWERRWRAVAEGAASAPDDAGCPYPGLNRYGPEDSDHFFGRDDLVAELLDLTRRRPFAALVGASGSGKSSLLRAGLVPAIRAGGSGGAGGGPAPSVVRILTPGPTPARTHKDLFTKGALVVVDQFEEVFTLCADPAERAAFTDLMVDGGARVVIAVRADFYGRCADQPALLRALKDAVLLVGPMGREQIREAVVGPATAARLVVERALTSRIVADVADEPGGLPLMAHTLREVWRRRRGRTMTVAAYDAVGGVRGAVAHTAEDVFGAFTADEAEVARVMLLRLVSPGEGTEDTRRPAARTGFAPPGYEHVLERLVRARLLTVDDTTADLAHEALLTAWPRLRAWIDADRDVLRLRRRLAEGSRVWAELGGDAGALLRGGQLEAARDAFGATGAGTAGAKGAGTGTGTGGPAALRIRWRQGWRYGRAAAGRAVPDTAETPPPHPARIPLTPAERAFLDASLAARAREARAALRAARRLRGLIVALSVLLCLAAVAGGVAWQQSRVSERRADESAARWLAGVADARRTTDPRTAIRLSVAAWRLAETPETREALFAAAAQPFTDVYTAPLPDIPNEINNVWIRLSDDARTMTAVGPDTTERWDVTGRTELPALSGMGAHADHILDISPDTTKVAYYAPDGIRIRDLRTGGPTDTVYGPSRPRREPNGDYAWFGPGGRTLVTHRDGEPVRLYDVRTGRALLGTGPERHDLRRVRVAPDAELLTFCPADGPLQVWDVRTDRRLPGTWARKAGICDAAEDHLFLPDGRTIAVTSEDGIRLWDVTTGRERPGFPTGGYPYPAFSADGSHAVTVAHEEIRLWRLPADAAPVSVLRVDTGNRSFSEPHLDLERGIIRFRDARLPGASVWTLSFQLPSSGAERSAAPVLGARYSPDGRTLATEHDGVRRLRELPGGRVVAELPAPRRPEPCGTLCRGAEFSPDGRHFAYREGPGSLAVRDIRSGAIRSVPLPPDATEGLSVSPGGRKVLTSRSAVERKSLDVLDVPGRRWSTLLDGPYGEVRATAPDGRVLTNTRYLADPRTGRFETVVPGEDHIDAAAFDPDGRFLAVADSGGRTTLWDGTGRELIAVLRDTDRAARSVPVLAFSADGRWLAVGDRDSAIRVWDTAAPDTDGSPLPSADGPVLAMGFSPDGRELRVTTPDTPTRSYSLAAEDAVRAACARAGGGPEPGQWAGHLPGVPYRDVCRDR
ncbi:WD40 repeat domain-containing protein [Streptomyces sp. NPDC058953]|uniref:WD40 repeat domain-containing protein n=1 Tax=unclassified Streptomyces TaxID=2593676 RepID=UPI0036C1215C